MKPYSEPKITVHGSLIDITKLPKPTGNGDEMGSGIMPPA